MGFLKKILGISERRQVSDNSLIDLANFEIDLIASNYEAQNKVSILIRKNEILTNSNFFNEVHSLLNDNEDNLLLSEQEDEYHYIWLTLSNKEESKGENLENLVSNTYIILDAGKHNNIMDSFLCTIFTFHRKAFENYKIYLIYSFTNDNFYPYVVTDNGERDSVREIEFMSLLKTKIKIEEDMSKWYPIKISDF